MPAKVLSFPTMAQHLDHYPNRIRELRLARKLSQEELGEMVGVSGVQIGYLELGKRELRLPMMRLLARAFGVSTAEVLAREDNPLMATPRTRRLLEHYGQADEPGRQAIERVAESLVGYHPQPEDTGLVPFPAPAAPQGQAPKKAAEK
jgi:transcriptional regulator with XRE-family HTH domain